MRTGRCWVPALTGGLVGLAVLVLPALAEELLGTVQRVDVGAQGLVISEKGRLTDVEVTVTGQTVIETPQGDRVPWEQLKTGTRVHVTHEDDVASKIVVRGVAQKKRDAPKSDTQG